MINVLPRFSLPLVAFFVVWYRAAECTRGSANADCFTPQNRRGLCVNLRECKELMWLLVNKRHDPKAINYLRNSQCGYQGNEPQVCCSSSSVITKTGILNSDQCGSVNINQRILGGEDVLLGEYPWMASLAYRKTGNRKPEWFCGGALISSRYVLTAAHCTMRTTPWELYMVRLGDLNLNDSIEDNATPQDILVDDVLVHEKYNQSPIINDIALIRLKSPAQTSSFVKPICLPLYPEFRTISLDNQNAVVAGWGRTALTGPFSSHLKDLEVPILDIDICKKAYSQRPGSYVDSRNLCVGFLNGEKDSCQGDSGGPLMWLNRTDHKFYVIGIVSYGFKCAERGYPGVYTRVSQYTDWISLSLRRF